MFPLWPYSCFLDAVSACLAGILGKVCQGHRVPKGYARFIWFTMLSLSQALRLGYLPFPHSAFQGHAAHIMKWSMMLRPKGS